MESRLNLEIKIIFEKHHMSSGKRRKNFPYGKIHVFVNHQLSESMPWVEKKNQI